MRTSKQWWEEVKADPEKFNRWLVKQYRGEVTAASWIEQFAETYTPAESVRTILDVIAELLDHWEKTEQAYAAMGFKTLSVDDFRSFGGYGIDIEPLLRVPRKAGEEPMFHAAYYRDHFLGTVSMSEAVSKAFQGEAAVGTRRPGGES